MSTESQPPRPAFDDAVRAVLAEHADPPTRYRGKVRVEPFVQGGQYWRETEPAAILRQHETAGAAHFAGIRYVEDAHGEPKEGYRELRGALRVYAEDGRVYLARDAERWELTGGRT